MRMIPPFEYFYGPIQLPIGSGVNDHNLLIGSHSVDVHSLKGLNAGLCISTSSPIYLPSERPLDIIACYLAGQLPTCANVAALKIKRTISRNWPAAFRQRHDGGKHQTISIGINFQLARWALGTFVKLGVSIDEESWPSRGRRGRRGGAAVNTDQH